MKKLILLVIIVISTFSLIAQQTFPTQMEGQYTCESRYGCNSNSTIFITRDSTNNTKFYFLDTCFVPPPAQVGGGNFLIRMKADSNLNPMEFEAVIKNCSAFGQFFFNNDSIYLYRSSKGCGSGCTCVLEYKCKRISTSISENAFSQLKIAPNPTNDFIQISGIKEKVHFSLISINGQILKDGIISNSSESINIKELDNGIYFLKIYTKDDISTQKIIKQ